MFVDLVSDRTDKTLKTTICIWYLLVFSVLNRGVYVKVIFIGSIASQVNKINTLTISFYRYLLIFIDVFIYLSIIKKVNSYCIGYDVK